MIDWLSAAELQRYLDAHAPIGVWLRDWFHARTDLDPRSTLPVAAELHVDEGLGEVHAWCGLVDATPFAIRSMRRPPGDVGLEVRFPVRRDGDGPHLDALARLGSWLPAWRSPWFDQLPIDAGSGVVGGADDAPIYTSRARADAAAVAAYLRRAAPASAWRVIEIRASAPTWIVVGPAAGPYVSRVETAASEDAARRLAARWATETGAAFDVRSRW